MFVQGVLRCEKLEGELLRVDNDVENEGVAKYMSQHLSGTDEEIWMGLRYTGLKMPLVWQIRV